MDQDKRQYGPAEGEEIKYLRNPLPVPPRRAHSVMEFDLQEEDLVRIKAGMKEQGKTPSRAVYGA